MWRATNNGVPNPNGDKTCDAVINDNDSGYCECENGKKAMEKGTEDLVFYGYAYNTCNEACSTKGALIRIIP